MNISLLRSIAQKYTQYGNLVAITRHEMRLEKCVIGFFITTLLACQGQVKPDFERLSQSMQATQVITPYHQHLVLTRMSSESLSSLNVYIEGDGRPWIKRYLVATDPTPRNPLALELMRRDKNPALYLGRPCYYNDPAYGLNDTGCDTSLWTSARYSQKVIDSMVHALRQLLSNTHYDQVTLIGHSGGGTIAMLMAQQMPEVHQLITVAANLDVAAWVKHHHYSALHQSLDPATIHSPRPLVQRHYGGGKDQIVPVQLNQAFLTRIRQPLIVKDDFDHHCCWIAYWPSLLEQNK